jgi:hypothetical protein
MVQYLTRVFPERQKHDLCFQHTAHVRLSTGSSLVSSGPNEFKTIIDDLVERMKHEKLVATGRCSKSGRFGKYVHIAGIPAYPHGNARLWVQKRDTPVWIGLNDDWKKTTTVRKRLQGLMLEIPSRAIQFLWRVLCIL